VETIPVGASGVSLATIGLGGFELGPEEGEQPDPERARKVVAAALEAGVNWLDTAEGYHKTRNEALIGEVLAGDHMLVATKVGPAPDGTGFRPEEIRAACLASLERLRRDRIDVYFLHWPDDTGVPLEETWGAMAELADEGLVRAIGLSNYPLADVERCHRQRPVDAIQDGLSLVDYLHNRALFAACAELGITGMVFEPMGSGALSGRSIDAIRESWAAYTEWDFYKRLLAGENGDRTADVIEAVRRVGDRLGASVAQVALAWVLAQSGVSAALAGTRSGDHLAENAFAAEIDVTGVLAELDEITSLGPTVLEG
jgi:aryl-alcohol dehydrogenase-like predicted oxidoreductase